MKLDLHSIPSIDLDLELGDAQIHAFNIGYDDAVYILGTVNHIEVRRRSEDRTRTATPVDFVLWIVSSDSRVNSRLILDQFDIFN
ncbi:MAG: hypothetical protein AAF125_14445, partial [Chloroflexota bacterium]